ncbi:M20/M25/M40 family metallo-hydrolase [Tsukamurella soli]|uniref:Peptidase n=1 Tax=Tsukamurella soli TaxID=644556 RepID=A0ABP8JGN1_9ACTN
MSETTDRIVRAVEARAEDTLALLQRLLRTPSVNPWFGDRAEISGEGGVQQLYQQLLTELDPDEFDVWEPSAEGLAHRADGPGYYPDHVFTGRPNVVARFRGTDPTAGALMIQGHSDVVSVGSGWTEEPFGGARRNGRVYGRGSADMKGGMAAALGAIGALRDAGVVLRADLLVASVVDEEAGGMGTLALVDRGHIAALGTIVPEATDLNVAPLCRGILWGEVTVHGRAGHIELKRMLWQDGGAVDAIEYGRRLLNAFAERSSAWVADPLKNHAHIPIPCAIKVAQIEGGEFPTTYASSCKITFNAQYLPAQKDEHGLGGVVKRELEQLIAGFAPEDEWLRQHPPTVRWLVDADCGETADDDPVVTRTLAAAKSVGIGSALEGCMSHVDMGLTIDAGSPTICFGPGQMAVAHQPDEYISETDVLAATKVLALTIADLCG